MQIKQGVYGTMVKPPQQTRKRWKKRLSNVTTALEESSKFSVSSSSQPVEHLTDAPKRKKYSYDRPYFRGQEVFQLGQLKLYTLEAPIENEAPDAEELLRLTDLKEVSEDDEQCPKEQNGGS